MRIEGGFEMKLFPTRTLGQFRKAAFRRVNFLQRTCEASLRMLSLVAFFLVCTTLAHAQSQNLPITGTVTINWGLSSRAISGSTTTDTVASTDSASAIVHIFAATGVVTETLPTATTLGNTNAFVFAYCNNSPQTDSIVPTTWTIQAGNAAASASLSVAPGVCYRIHPDPSSATNWLAELEGSSSATGVSEATLNACTSSGAINSAATWGCFYVFANTHTLVRLVVTAVTTGSGCATNGVIALRDTTASSLLATVTVPNSTTVIDSGALSVSMPAGHQFRFDISTAASGCSTTPNVVAEATYQ